MLVALIKALVGMYYT